MPARMHSRQLFYPNEYAKITVKRNAGQDTRGREAGMSFYGCETAPENVRELYTKFLKAWCAETCAPRMRPDWSEQNPTLGQCSITSFIVQDLLGGEVYGILLPDGAYHCFNEVDGFRFDLTSEQFGDEKLNYENCVPQTREDHFSNADKYARYLLLKERLGCVL